LGDCADREPNAGALPQEHPTSRNLAALIDFKGLVFSIHFTDIAKQPAPGHCVT
jgi:hypothetical protein